MARGRRINVAVIGGGCAAISTAFELSRPEHGGKYAITVYQLGWRLGGKGASGRGPAQRIEEHGLHVWMGFYDNAFRLLRECYAELKRDPEKCPIADWRDAFVPDPYVGVADRAANGRWLHRIAGFPSADGLPGDPIIEKNPFTVRGYLMHTVALLRTLLLDVQTEQTLEGPSTTAADPDCERRERIRCGCVTRRGDEPHCRAIPLRVAFDGRRLDERRRLVIGSVQVTPYVSAKRRARSARENRRYHARPAGIARY